MSEKPLEYIVVTSDEPWGDIWHTQLHYANQLSKYFFVIFLYAPAPWKFSNILNWNFTSQKVNDNLLTIRYHNFIPASFGKMSLWINDKVNQIRINKIIKGKKRGIIWHLDPFRSLYLMLGNKNVRQLYHVIDPIAGHNLDPELISIAEVIVVTSPKFFDYYKKLHANVIQIPQGVDVDFYKNAPADPKQDLSVSKDSFLLVGTFSNEIDYDLLEKISSGFPNKLVMIGPDTTTQPERKALLEKLKSHSNVAWLGPMSPASFIGHLRNCKLGIITYDLSKNQRNNLRSPLKAISYLATGKPIISNIDCEIPELQGKAIYNVGSHEEFFTEITRVIEGKRIFDQEAVDTYLHKIDYRNLLSKIFNLLQEDFPSK